MSNGIVRRCLIVERHAWETGGNAQQMQFVLATARQFFGWPETQDQMVTLRVFVPINAAAPTSTLQITIGREYPNSTRRTNSFPLMGTIPPSFVFFQDTDQPLVYDFWWQESDMQIVGARYDHALWVQGHDSQHGRGRLSAIVDAPVPRPCSRID